MTRPSIHRTTLAAGALAATLAGTAVESRAQDTEVSGWAAVEVRVFTEPSRHPGQDPQRIQPSFMFQPELRADFFDGAGRLTIIPYLRVDQTDRERSHLDLREAYVQYLGDSWDVLAGLGKVFWGVTESRHLVDIINQTDVVDDVDLEEKLGQPMINANMHTEYGSFGLFVLPGFREATSPGWDGRLRATLPVETHKAQYESSAKDHHVDFAARWAHNLGDFDIGLAHFWGTSREPRYGLGLDDLGRPVLIPFYDIIHQSSVDLQATLGAWLLKFEGISRWGHRGDNHFLAAVAGFEYTFFDLFETGTDVGLLLEYLYDGRNSLAPPTANDDDIFFGSRIALNNTQDTEFLVGAIIDRHNQATAARFEADHRIGDSWKIEVEGQFFMNVPVGDNLKNVTQDDHVQVRLFRYF
ncbi:MAG: hypothetical protein H6907_16380 [Hyphomicrobiales bacterium]|nr:hypothetical protein [Hyphomicrobiales bacterium]MCP5373304.1 hypothetical protein [Hyphomicrobiales bacterium]